MDKEKRKLPEDIDQQIDSELDKRSDLILDNIKIAPIVEKLGQHDSLKKHLERGQWLNPDQLKVLNLDPETEKSYSELREFYQKQEKMTDDDRLLEHLEKENQIIKDKNKLDSEALFKERCHLEADVIKESLKAIGLIQKKSIPVSVGDFHTAMLNIISIVGNVRGKKIRQIFYVNENSRYTGDNSIYFHPVHLKYKETVNEFIKILFNSEHSYEEIFNELKEINIILSEELNQMNLEILQKEAKSLKGKEAISSTNPVRKFLKRIFK